jgi:four helix bundle protein
LDFGGSFKFGNGFYIRQFKIKFASIDKKELQERLKKYAIAIVKFSEELPDKSGFRTVKNQIVRSGPSSAANDRSACRAKSTKDYISKMETVEEELDETMFWLEFTVGLSEEYRLKVAPLWKEGDELLAIIVASIISTKKNSK